MILIVEGANRAGKSTMIDYMKKLADNSGVEFVLYNERINKNEHAGTTPEGMYAYTKNIIGDLLKQDTNENLIVFDRFHISEFVYGEAIQLRQGKHLAVFDVKIKDDENRVLDSGEFTFFLTEHEVIAQKTE